MLPGVSPCAVGQRVTDLVVGDGIAIVGGQQVAPSLVTVGIGDGICGCYTFQTAGGVGILFPVENIARIIVSPGVGEIACLVIFPNQLVGTVVDIACGIRAVTDTQDIAVIVVGGAQGRPPPLGLCFVMYPEGRVPSGALFFGLYLPKREQNCYVLASIAFWGQKAVCWDNPKPLKVSGIFLTSLCLGDQTRCLLVHNCSVPLSVGYK